MVNITVREGQHISLASVARLMNHAYEVGQLEKQQQVKNVLGIK